MSFLSTKRRARRRGAGHAVMEFALVAPWIFFVFIGVLDFGFYAYWLMSVTNASRTAALVASLNGASQGVACNEVLNEMRGVLGWKAADTAGSCNGAPLTVTVTPLDNASNPLSADGSASILVSVTWQTEPLLPVPGILQQFTIRRDAEMRRQ